MQYLDNFIVPLIDLVGITITIAVIAQDRKKNSNLVFATLVTTILGWITFAFLSDYFRQESLSLLFNRLVFVSLAFLGPILLHFSFIFPHSHKHNGLTTKLAYFLGALLAAISLFSNLVVSGVTFKEFGSELITGQGYYLLLTFLFVVFVASIYHFLIKYKEAQGQEKSQLQIFFLGITAVVAVNLIVYYVVRPIVGSDRYYKVGNYSSILFVLGTAYSIVAHRLFDIRAVVTAVVALGLNIVLLTQIFLSRSAGELLLKSLVTVLVAIGSYSLVRNVSREIARRKEIEQLAAEKTETLKELEQRNKNLAALQKVSKMVLNQNEMRPMLQAILDEIPKQFDNCNGALLNLVKGGHLAAYAISSNEFTKKIYSLVGSDLDRYSYPIKKDFNMLHNALIEHQLKESTRLSDFISPPIGKPVAATIQTLTGLKYVLAVPLFAGKEPLGVMLFAYRVPKEQLEERDVDMATAIADETSLAIQRAYAFEQLKSANEYLADLDKLKDEFISMASHELNTPLAAVEGYLSMILDEHMGKVDKKASVYLHRAYDSSKRLAELILDLLNVSRIEQGRVKMKFAKTNLYDLAESVLHELQVKVDAKKLTIKLEADKKAVPETWCDPDRIREVIVNLVGNSIKYTEKGGIVMKIGADAGKLRFDVIDTGRGISADGQKKLFQKFSQVKREIDEQKGTGLGLYISKNFVELHKGRIWVESEEGKGSDFIFELPVLTEPPEKIDGAILEGPLSAPRVELQDKKPPALVTASTEKGH
ncbi:MAG: GAF domain-containing protein [Candidatus Berkelbacteria bacterium]|nr:MAG: GAF domain-containing protein [Candidatus Berkelbacteria bacterium]QQG51587.1 MAG: GAF domain-containing protein [Candidatus Berkelbacteria bacterium]